MGETLTKAEIEAYLLALPGVAVETEPRRRFHVNGVGVAVYSLIGKALFVRCTRQAYLAFRGVQVSNGQTGAPPWREKGRWMEIWCEKAAIQWWPWAQPARNRQELGWRLQQAYVETVLLLSEGDRPAGWTAYTGASGFALAPPQES